MEEIDIRPIGYVRSRIKERSPPHQFKELISHIEIRPELAQALDGIEKSSHIFIIFWLHKTEDRSVLRIHPRGDSDLPLTGVFATRSPARPNPIGLSIVQLLDRKDNVLEVKGLDAIDGTPVLDIKPYTAPRDSVGNPSGPRWRR